MLQDLLKDLANTKIQSPLQMVNSAIKQAEKTNSQEDIEEMFNIASLYNLMFVIPEKYFDESLNKAETLSEVNDGSLDENNVLLLLKLLNSDAETVRFTSGGTVIEYPIEGLFERAELYEFIDKITADLRIDAGNAYMILYAGNPGGDYEKSPSINMAYIERLQQDLLTFGASLGFLRDSCLCVSFSDVNNFEDIQLIMEDYGFDNLVTSYFSKDESTLIYKYK